MTTTTSVKDKTEKPIKGATNKTVAQINKEAKAKARTRAEVERKAKAEKVAELKAKEKAKADKEAKAKAVKVLKEAKAKAKAEAKAQAEADKEAKAAAKSKAEAEAKARADADLNTQLEKGAEVITQEYFDAIDEAGKKGKTATDKLKLAYLNTEVGDYLVSQCTEKLNTYAGGRLKRFKADVKNSQKLFNKANVQDDIAQREGRPTGKERTNRVYFGLVKEPMVEAGISNADDVGKYTMVLIEAEPKTETLTELDTVVGDWIEKAREQIPCTNPTAEQVQFLKEAFANSIETIKAEQERYNLI
jgi:hypothetical protein